MQELAKLFFIFVVCTFLTVTQAVAQETGTPNNTDIDSKRALFLGAEEAIAKGRNEKAATIIQQLGAYELVPFLEASLLINNIHEASTDEVNKFIQSHKNTWLAEKVRLNWLIVLDARRKYHEYIDLYPESTPSTVSTCRYAEALIRTNQETAAFELAPNLWLTGKSQPNECDFLFDRWKRSDTFSEEYIWQRYILARKAGENRFARYLRRSAKSSEVKKRISLYLDLRDDPTIILSPENLSVTEPGRSDLIRYGIRRLADEDPFKAETSLNYYRTRAQINETQYNALLNKIMREFTDAEHFQNALNLANAQNGSLSDSHIDWQVRSALSDLDWQRAIDWMDLLSEENANKEKWQYWAARAKNQLGTSAAGTYQNIADERSYYGFLSAMMIEQPYALRHNPVAKNIAILQSIKQIPGVKRAIELQAVGYHNNSRQSWNYALKDLPVEHRTIAAEVALEANMHYLAIRSMAIAKYWDDLEIRYPLAFHGEYKKSAVNQQVDLSWIYGISRQESSFAPDVRSPSGALGLMQVMPGTARDMARDLGVKYERGRLTEPAYNIPLGTAYLSKGQAELSGNLVYATAGYNAGINRVKTWLEDGREALPLDVWVETIPFSETRKYVKNVLAYSVIYASKLGLTSPMERHNRQFFAVQPSDAISDSSASDVADSQ